MISRAPLAATVALVFFSAAHAFEEQQDNHQLMAMAVYPSKSKGKGKGFRLSPTTRAPSTAHPTPVAPSLSMPTAHLTKSSKSMMSSNMMGKESSSPSKGAEL